MHRYFEMFEMPTELSLEPPIIQDIQYVRIEINEDSKATALIEEYRKYFEGTAWKAQIHYCNHETNESCSTKLLESEP